MRVRALVLSAVVTAMLVGCAAQETQEMAAEPAAKASMMKAAVASAAMLSNTCAGCHGTNGLSQGASPTIAGLSEDYFVEVMKAYRTGDRASTIMQRIAKGYTDEEIAAMAGYFSAKPYKARTQTSTGPMARAGHKLHDEYCDKCHENEGRSVDDDSGLLAGQSMEYLRWTLEDYIDGASKISEKKMKRALDKMLKAHGPGSLEKLVHYYGSRR